MTTTKRGHVAARQAQRRKAMSAVKAPKKIEAEVTLTKGTPAADPTGVRKLWAFGLRDLANLFGITEGAVRTAIFEKRVDPTDLQSIALFWRTRADRRAAKRAA